LLWERILVGGFRRHDRGIVRVGLGQENAVKSVKEQLEAAVSHQRVGDHETVEVCKPDDPEIKLRACRKCVKSWLPVQGWVNAALLEDCEVAEEKKPDWSFVPKARGSSVVVRLEVLEQSGGIKLPEKSPEGKLWFVDSVGEKVENLKVGDQVEPNGEQNVDWAFIPRFPNLIVINERNIVLTYEKIDKNAGEPK
jgi:hypothetical protein